MKRNGSVCVVIAACVGFCLLPCSPAGGAPPPNPRVGIMPGYPNAPHCDPSEKRPVRPGVKVIVWGNANGGDGTAIGSTYSFTFSANPNVQVVPAAPPLNGTITNDRYIFEEVTFNLLNNSTKECVTATLSVTFPGPVTKTNSVEIAIIAPTDPSSNTPLSGLQIDVDIGIEDGLRALYLMQATNGSWPAFTGTQHTCASTGFALWAFQNQGHLPSNPQGQDIYSEFVERGLEFILSGAAAFGTAAANADIPRGATANGVSDLNTNTRSINLCPGPNTAYYAPPIAAAAIIASLEPTRVVGTGPFAGATFTTILEDVIDWIGTVQNAVSATGPRGGWYYQAGFATSDMSINSWYYLALEGIQFVNPPCDSSGGGTGVTVPDWIKQEAEYALVYHQNNAAGPQPFGYGSSTPLRGPADAFATTSGGLSGLALVGTETPTLPVGAIFAAESPPLNTIAAKRQAALDYLGTYWNNTVNASMLGYANRGNFYAMWTTARALRITAKAMSLPAGQKVVLIHGGLKFDWETGETLTPTPQGNVPGAADPREGYFPFLLRNQDTVSGATTRGRWSMGTYLNSYSGSMETSLGVLILVNRVFGPECQISCPEDIVVKCEGPGGAVVHYDVTTSGCPQGTTIVCSPPSGSLFPVGVTQVQCYALLPCGDKKSLPCCFKVTVEEPCACLEVVDKKIDCGKQQGEYTYSFNVTNLSGVPVTRIKLLPCDMDGDLLPDFTISPDLFNLGTPLPNGSSTTLNVTLSGVDPTKKACFEIWMFDQKFQRCCRLKHCIELPDCCLELVQSKVDCDPVAPGQYNWTFQVQNKAPYTIDRLFLWPPSGITMTPTSFILPPLATGQTSGPLSVQITGGQPGDVLCFEISIHESATDKCCYQTICITLPDCNPCKVEDSCELTPTITLCREGDLLRGVVKLTICNYCNEQPVEFQYALDGFTDPSCPVKYLSPGNFSPSSGATLPLARGECETIAITITSSFGQFPPMSTACYKATITNLATGEQFSCVAKARSPKVNSPIKVVGDPKDPVGIPRDRIRPITFQASSLTSVAASLSYELRTEEPGETSAAVISLNGLPPGTPVRGTLDVPPGAVQLVTVEVRFAVHQPLGFFEVGLYGVSADGQAEALAVTGVRSVDPTDCNQNGVPDDVDILLCNSEDKDGDGIPDECEGTPLVRGQDSFRRGDSNGDGAFDIGDGVCILDYLFLGRKAPACEDAADADDSGTVDMSDAVSVLGYLFLGKAAPAAPGPRECGQDPTDDGLGCAMHLPCN